MNPDWHTKFRDSGARLFKFVKDNIRDETRRTLPKTNERDRRNQPEGSAELAELSIGIGARLSTGIV